MQESYFFTVAGISSVVPCFFPLGDELHKILLHNFTDLIDWALDGLLNIARIPLEQNVKLLMDGLGPIDERDQAFNLIKRHVSLQVT